VTASCGCIRRTLSFLFCVLFSAQTCCAEGEIDSLKEYEYWDNGNIRKCAIYDTNGHLKAKAHCRREDGSLEKMEKYDRYGNKIEEAYYDDKGNLRTGVDGWAAKRWWYDETQLVSQITYNASGASMERKHYSDGGKLIARQYLDKENDTFGPYESASMAIFLGPQNTAYRRRGEE
jgi:antitoxin component YwqK of YwqJK toxin-antitoxin module